MQKIIDVLKENTIAVIFCIIIVIVIALLIIIYIEKRNKNKYLMEFEKYDENYNKEKVEINENDNFEDIKDQTIAISENIVYEEKTSVKEAKKAIEEAAKKLVYEEQDIIGQTFFEKMQEENSIISYDELISKNIDVDYENEKVLEDEGNEPITIDELYSMSNEETEEEKQKKEEKMVYYVNSESKKFKNSEVISPVFGVKRDVIYKKEYNELGETINIKELDMEIKKTEEFLKELKKLKSKLD